MLEGAPEIMYLQVPFGKGKRKVTFYSAVGMRNRKMCSLCHQCFWPSGASFWVISHANTFTFLENKELASKLKAKQVQLYQSYMRNSDINQNNTCPEWQIQTEYWFVEIWDKSDSRFIDLLSLKWFLVVTFSPGWYLSLCCWVNYSVSWSSGRKFSAKSRPRANSGIREKHSLWYVSSKRGTIAGLDSFWYVFRYR